MQACQATHFQTTLDNRTITNIIPWMVFCLILKGLSDPKILGNNGFSKRSAQNRSFFEKNLEDFV